MLSDCTGISYFEAISLLIFMHKFATYDRILPCGDHFVGYLETFFMLVEILQKRLCK